MTEQSSNNTNDNAVTTTTQEAVESLLERFYYQGWNKANDQIMRQVLAPNVEFRGSFRRKPLRGLDAFLDYMHKAHAALGNNKTRMLEIVISSDDNKKNKAAVRLVNRGIHKGNFFGVPGSGHEVSWNSAAFFTLNDKNDKIAEIWVLGDIDNLKHQIGAPADTTAF